MKVKICPFMDGKEPIVPAFKLDIPGLIIAKLEHGVKVSTIVVHEPTGIPIWWPAWDWYEHPVSVPLARKCALKAQKAVKLDWLRPDIVKQACAGKDWQWAADDALLVEEERLWEINNKEEARND